MCTKNILAVAYLTLKLQYLSKCSSLLKVFFLSITDPQGPSNNSEMFNMSWEMIISQTDFFL